MLDLLPSLIRKMEEKEGRKERWEISVNRGARGAAWLKKHQT